MARYFTREHLEIFQKYAGTDWRVEGQVTEEKKKAQEKIKEAHELVLDWATGVKNIIDPNANNPKVRINAINQGNKFRQFLPQTFAPSHSKCDLLCYWFFLDTRDRAKPFLKMLVGLYDDKVKKNLVKKLDQIRNSLGGVEKFEASLSAEEILSKDMEELIDWGVRSIEKMPLSYDQIFEKLEPEILQENEESMSVSIENRAISFWVEKCKVRGRLDRESGEYALGNVLWSPQKSEAGADVYKNMREVNPGDLIFHLTDNECIRGISIVSSNVDTNFQCLDGTDWEGKPGYKVSLEKYIELDQAITRELIFEDKEFLKEILQKNSNLFYNKRLELNQGAYLTKLPNDLAMHFNTIYVELTGTNLPHFTGTPSKREMYNYTVKSIIEEGCFLDEENLNKIIDRLRLKKNLILQGPPGTGKTWLAKRLGYSIIGSKDHKRLRSFQFHPNLSYEDFVRGYRPSENEKLELVDGPFMQAIEAAKKSDQPYVVVIEEINRGNPAQIFGEMLTLLEADKRNSDESLELTYQRANERIFIPNNLYVIGTMNIADRSLALVDLALRRRFAFVSLEPSLNDKWKDWVIQKCGIDRDFAVEIKRRIDNLNQMISSDQSLGPQYQIGHSFVTPTEVIENSKTWFEQVVETEIGPLIEEYWFENIDKAKDIQKELTENL